MNTIYHIGYLESKKQVLAEICDLRTKENVEDFFMDMRRFIDTYWPNLPNNQEYEEKRKQIRDKAIAELEADFEGLE